MSATDVQAAAWDALRAQRRAEEKQAKQMASDSASRRVTCPGCGARDTYTYRRSGELLFCCYACGNSFDDAGVAR